jgi:mono/diheme cytochrome c family protein
MVDVAPLGTWLGANLTTGKGSAVANYTTADWDRMVRHGVKPDGSGSIMPSDDFVDMSDQELSDLIVAIRAAPPVDRVQPKPTFGPVGRFLLAKGDILLTAERADPNKAHAPLPPASSDAVAFGKHLLTVCTGCHGATLAGGPIVGGDPSWPPAAALRGATGMPGWSFEDFQRAMKEGKSKDGRALVAPMSNITPYTARFTETELKAIWAALKT